jgi:hypothetical protein
MYWADAATKRPSTVHNHVNTDKKIGNFLMCWAYAASKCPSTVHNHGIRSVAPVSRPIG